MDDRPVAVVEGGQVYFVRTDHIGRPVFATASAGVKVWEASYLPFGGVHTSFGTNMDLRFPGQWFQAEHGLHQNWMREYDPTTGRYLQADPLGLVDGASVYGYALQSPMYWTDPTGECVGPWAIACASAASAAINVGIGIVLDYYLGDGCYTWEELGRDAAIGAMFGGLGAAWSSVGAGVRYGQAAAHAAGAKAAQHWQWGATKSPTKWANQASKRGWTPTQITEAIAKGKRFPAENKIRPQNGASRYVHPETGRSVVVDDVTREVIHIGGDGFRY